MILIAHRGNIRGPEPERENSPGFIDEALALGFDCEVDLWVDKQGDFSLGHDRGNYAIEVDWLKARSPNLWIHCKNLRALEKCKITGNDLNFFWHETDKYTLTSLNFIWTYPLQAPPGALGVIVCQDLAEAVSASNRGSERLHGLCSDYGSFLREGSGST